MLNKNLSLDVQPLVAGAVIILATVVAANLIRWMIDRVIRRTTGNGSHDPTSLLFTKRIVLVILYLVGLGLALAQFPRFKDLGHSLIAGAGVLTLITGLASQQVLSNIMSGILIVVFKPFRLNDKITLNGMTGTVEDINLRQIVLRDVENNRIVIPNAIVSSNALVNFNHTDTRCCKAIEIGIGYNSDIDLALSVMLDEVARHPLHIDARTPDQIANQVPPVVARVVALGDSTVNVKVWAWAKDATDGYVMYCDLLKSLKQRFDREGIEIPFPQRTVTLAGGNQADAPSHPMP
ncbi:MAG: mechanosensitive ion channel family protein [Rhodanobacter sp.]|nr:MAG: mechanosensitive ion channel family protein [Rhodanobacter sp.]